jgi:hypothetical protein
MNQALYAHMNNKRKRKKKKTLPDLCCIPINMAYLIMFIDESYSWDKIGTFKISYALLTYKTLKAHVSVGIKSTVNSHVHSCYWN